jgi:glycosyltransferase involved in cell wall biosynthesis
VLHKHLNVSCRYFWAVERVQRLIGKGVSSVPSAQVIIAALNEAEGIGPTIAELRATLGNARILVVDGNSHDRSVEIAKNTGADIVYQDGLGKGNAIAKGIEHADLDVDYVVFTDADYTYPAGYLPEMIKLLEENPSVGMVCGNRFNHHLDVKALHNVFYFGNRLLAFTHNMFNGVALRDPLTGLRVLRGSILKGWLPNSKSFDIEVELNHHVERMGYSIMEADIKYRPRLGEKKLKLRHGATILRRILIETVK